MTPDIRVIPSATRPLRGSVRVPGSKSISNRVLLLAALARGTSNLQGVLRSDDTDAMLAGLADLGVSSRWIGDVLEIDGCAGVFPRGATIEVGHGGTPARFLMIAAAIAGGPVRAVIEAAGIHDLLAKTLGTNNPVNVIHATVAGLKSLRSAHEIAALRDKAVEDVAPGAGT